MDIAAFQDWIDRLGEDLSRWPDDQRTAAEQLLAASADARAIHAEACALRAALLAPPVRAPSGLVDRIVTKAAKLPKDPSSVLDVAAADQPEKASADAEAAHGNKMLPTVLLTICVTPVQVLTALFDELSVSLSLAF